MFIWFFIVAALSFLTGVIFAPKIRTDIKYIESKMKDKALNTINKL